MLSSSLPLNEQNNSNDLINLKSRNENQDFEELTKEEIIEKINDKKKQILDYYNINKSLKKQLTEILEKLNDLSKNYINELNPNQNNLQTQLNNKKNEYIKNKSNNSLLKMKYNILLKKTREISGKRISNIITEKKISVDKLKQENFQLNKDIKKNYIESTNTKNEIIKMTNNNFYINNLDTCSYKLKKFLDNKNKYIKAFNTTKILLSEKMNDVKNLEDNIKLKYNIYSKNQKGFNKIKEDLNKIRTGLLEVLEELDKKNINDNILILNNILQKNELSTNSNTTISHPQNNINIVIAKHPLKNHKPIRERYTYLNNCKNKVILKPLLNKSKSTSLIKNKFLYNNSINSDLNNLNSNLNKKNLNLRNKFSINNISTNISVTMNNNCLSYEQSKIKFKETDDEAYRNLLNKKENYMEESERVSKNIKQAQRTYVFKNTKMLHHLQINIKELNDIKNENKGHQEEIKKLQELIQKLKAENKKIMENGMPVKKE